MKTEMRAGNESETTDRQGDIQVVRSTRGYQRGGPKMPASSWSPLPDSDPDSSHDTDL